MYINNLKKYIIYFFYFLILIILIFLIYKNFSKTKEFEKIKSLKEELNQKITTEKMEDLDTDIDGLKDWEEILYGTNPELADTDGDGYSDWEEVRKNKDPLIWGDGKSINVEKILITKENIWTLEDQKKKINKIFKKQENLNKIFLELSKKNELTSKESSILKKEEIRKGKLKEELNLMGKVLLSHTYILENYLGILIRMNLFFIPQNEKNAQELSKVNENIKIDKIPKYRAINDKEIEKIKKLISSYKTISKTLKSLEISDYDLKNLTEDLIISYQKLRESLENILKKNIEGKRNIEDIYLVKEYNFAVKYLGMSRKNINSFIIINDLKFSDKEAGKLFVYSL